MIDRNLLSLITKPDGTAYTLDEIYPMALSHAQDLAKEQVNKGDTSKAWVLQTTVERLKRSDKGMSYLNRVAVLFIRHHLTNYDAILKVSVTRSKRDLPEYTHFKVFTLECIAYKYPKLYSECETQANKTLAKLHTSQAPKNAYANRSYSHLERY